MSDLPAEPSAPASQPHGESRAARPQPAAEGWTRNKFVFFVAVALVLHVALIIVFGTKKQIVPRAVTNVPHLRLADSADELIALGDPTLFARPNAQDFVTEFWLRPPAVKQQHFSWTEDPRYLPPAPDEFGAVFCEFMQANPAPETPLNFKPEPKLIKPAVVFDEAMPQATTMQISGDLARRRRFNQIEPPLIPVNDVIAPSVVQALVDTAGNVASTVLLDSSTDAEADQLALQLARTLRFVPAPRLMFGQITFNWHTVPVTSTNEPSR
jgi:TonB family protein